MEEKFDRELTAKIKTLVEERGAEHYEIGAWESFESSAFGMKRSPYRFLWIGLAASFLMAMSIGTIYNTSYKGVSEGTPYSTHSKKEDSASEFNFSSGKIDFVKNNNPDKNTDSYQVKSIVHNESGNQESMPSFNMSWLSMANRSSSKVTYSGRILNSGHDEVKFRPYPGDITNDQLEKHRRAIKIGVALTSYMNKIDQSRSGLNWGGGVIAEIPLHKNISFTTGIIVSQQTLDFKKNQNTEGNRTIETRGKFVVFDLPFNIKYNFLKRRKKELFVSAGVSSLAYAKADYKDKIRSPKRNKEASEVKSEQAFSHFDFGKILNLSMGIEVPLDKQLSILLEPYLKYPLETLTSREIKYCSAGINLKINMGLAKLN